MSTDSKSTSTFSPQPEAHAVESWSDLLPPVCQAIRDLLTKIAGATKKPETPSGSQTAINCFLVCGDRGTGKTTVLLNTQKAITSSSFFTPKKPQDSERTSEKSEQQEEPERQKKICDEARAQAECVRNGHVVWLDILDLQPLPSTTNLLTTILTRIVEAPEQMFRGSHSPSERRSILEEGTDSARQSLKRLINDATLMWEDIAEQDTRSRAAREVTAAEIYARYQQRFRKAMGTLSAELAHLKGLPNGTCCPIILPIDKIDRSTTTFMASSSSLRWSPARISGS